MSTVQQANAEQVQAVRTELLRLKEELKTIQGAYKERAEQRVAYQNKMAKLNEMIQLRSKDDVMLVEDAIVVTLMAENTAHERYDSLPGPPTKKAEPVVAGQRTKNAEEALRIYRSQIEELQDEINYRTELGMAERDVDIIYRTAVDDILDIMDAYCKDPKLKADVERFAQGGSAPSSPRKSPKKKGVARILAAPSSMFIAHKPTLEEEDILPPTPSRVKDPSQKVDLSKMNDTIGGLPSKLTAPSLFDDSDEEADNVKDKNNRDIVEEPAVALKKKKGAAGDSASQSESASQAPTVKATNMKMPKKKKVKKRDSDGDE